MARPLVEPIFVIILLILPPEWQGRAAAAKSLKEIISGGEMYHSKVAKSAMRYMPFKISPSRDISY